MTQMRKTPKEMFVSAKFPLHVLLHRLTQTLQRHPDWSLQTQLSSSHLAIRLHHFNRPSDKHTLININVLLINMGESFSWNTHGGRGQAKVSSNLNLSTAALKWCECARDMVQKAEFSNTENLDVNKCRKLCFHLDANIKKKKIQTHSHKKDFMSSHQLKEMLYSQSCTLRPLECISTLSGHLQRLF